MSFTSFVRKFIWPFVPKRFQHSLIRRGIALSYEEMPEFRVRLAESRQDLEAAFKLLHESYVSAGLMQPDPSGLRVTPYHALPTTSMIVAEFNGEIVGTISVVRKSTYGLPIEKLCSIHSLYKDSNRIAEISSLAVKKEFRQNGKILFPLFKYIYHFCFDYLKTDRLVIAVHPTHFPMYQAILGFEQIQGTRVEKYNFVNGAPAVMATLDISKAPEDYASLYAGKPPSLNMHTYFRRFEAKKTLVFPKRNYYKVAYPVLSPEDLEYFFFQRTKAIPKMTDAQKRTVLELYNAAPYVELFNRFRIQDRTVFVKREKRFDAESPGAIQLAIEDPSQQKTLFFQMENASKNGLGGRLIEEQKTNFSAPPDQIYEIAVRLGDFDVAQIRARLVWRDGLECGFQILNSSGNWNKYIERMDQEINDPLSKVA